MEQPTPQDEGLDLAGAGPVFRQWYAERARHPRPLPGLEGAPVTMGQYQYRTPEKFELFGGYLFGPGDDPWWRARREDLLALLLANVGLLRAVRLAPAEAWRAALAGAPPGAPPGPLDGAPGGQGPGAGPAPGPETEPPEA